MRHPLFQSFLIIFVIGNFIVCSNSPDRQVVATVGKEKIRAPDLIQFFREQENDFNPELLGDPEGNLAVKKILLDRLIEKRLLLQVAKEKKIFASPNKERKVIEKLIEQEVGAPIKMSKNSPEEIELVYQKSPNRFHEPDQVRCRQIVTDKKEKAERILALLNQGENFAALAQKYSESPDREKGGDLGWIKRGEVPAVFEQVCFSLGIGQTSGVIPSDYGFHIFRTVEKKAGRQIPLNEATPVIDRELREAKMKESLKSWIENLQENRKIVIDEEVLKRIEMTPSQ